MVQALEAQLSPVHRQQHVAVLRHLRGPRSTRARGDNAPRAGPRSAAAESASAPRAGWMDHLALLDMVDVREALWRHQRLLLSAFDYYSVRLALFCSAAPLPCYEYDNHPLTL